MSRTKHKDGALSEVNLALITLVRGGEEVGRCLVADWAVCGPSHRPLGLEWLHVAPLASLLPQTMWPCSCREYALCLEPLIGPGGPGDRGSGGLGWGALRGQ